MHVRVFDVDAEGSVSNSRVLVEQPISERHPTGVPDGMKVDRDGNLYATGPGGVWVVRPDGDVLGVVTTPEIAHNLTWGGRDRRTLFITAGESLYRLQTNAQGAAPAHASDGQG